MSVVVGPWGSKPVKQGAMPGTFEALCWEWLGAKAKDFRPSWAAECERLLKRGVWPAIGSSEVGGLARRDVAAVLEALPRSVSRTTHTVLSSLLAWAVETGRLEVNPIAGMRRSKAKARERVLSVPELKAIWLGTAGGSDFDRIVRLLLLTGQRRDEWGDARWTEVREGCLCLPASRTKNAKAHKVPLAALARAQLPPQRAGRAFLFGKRRDKAFSGWSNCKARLDRRLGLGPWRLHDLRRSFVTHTCELEMAAPHVVEAFVNHQSGHKGGVAGIYNRAEYWKERCELADKWAALFE